MRGPQGETWLPLHFPVVSHHTRSGAADHQACSQGFSQPPAQAFERLPIVVGDEEEQQVRLLAVELTEDVFQAVALGFCGLGIGGEGAGEAWEHDSVRPWSLHLALRGYRGGPFFCSTPEQGPPGHDGSGPSGPGRLATCR